MTSAYNLGQTVNVLSGRNRIINGACNVAQRGSAAFGASAVGYAGPDRFIANNSSSAGQFTQSQGTITYNGVARNACVQTVNTATTTFSAGNFWGGIGQRIEGYNVHDLLGQQISVSFIFNTNVTGTYTLAIQDASTNSYVTTFSATANTPTKYSFNLPALGNSFNIPNSSNVGMIVWIGALNAGTYVTTASTSWQSGNFISTSGATNWAASVNNFIAVTELQLEAGPVATLFERETIDTTVAKCRRYYYTTSTSNMDWMWITYTSNGDTRGRVPHPVTMRATPSMSFNTTSWNCVGFGNTSAIVNQSVVGVTPNGVTIDSWGIGCTGNTGAMVTASFGPVVVWGSNQGITVTASAEL